MSGVEPINKGDIRLLYYCGMEEVWSDAALQATLP